jgi:hypothetical protein
MSSLRREAAGSKPADYFRMLDGEFVGEGRVDGRIKYDGSAGEAEIVEDGKKPGRRIKAGLGCPAGELDVVEEQEARGRTGHKAKFRQNLLQVAVGF